MPRFLRYKTPTGQVLEVEWSGKGEPTQEDIAYGRELAMREFQKTGPMQMGAYAGAKGQGVYTPPKPAKPGPLPKFLQPAPKPLPKPQAKTGLMSKVDELAPKPPPGYVSPSDWVRAERKRQAVEYMQSQQDIALGRKSVGPPRNFNLLPIAGAADSEDEAVARFKDDELGQLVEALTMNRAHQLSGDLQLRLESFKKRFIGEGEGSRWDLVSRLRTEQARRLGEATGGIPVLSPILAFAAGLPYDIKKAAQAEQSYDTRGDQRLFDALSTVGLGVGPAGPIDDIVNLGIKGIGKALGIGAKGAAKVADYFAGKSATQSGEAVAKAVREARFSTSDTGLLDRLKEFIPKEAPDYKPGEVPNITEMASRKNPINEPSMKGPSSPVIPTRIQQGPKVSTRVETPSVPGIPDNPAKAKEPWDVGQKLVSTSPDGRLKTEVSYRGPGSPGKSVVFDTKSGMQFEIPNERLAKIAEATGENSGSTKVSSIKNNGSNPPKIAQVELWQMTQAAVNDARKMHNAETFAPYEWEVLNYQNRRTFGHSGSVPVVQGANGRVYAPDEWQYYHGKDIEKALSEGKFVSAEALADYPDLAKKYAKPNSSEIPEKSAVPDSSIPSKPINELSMKDAGVEPPTVPPKPTESGMPKSSPGSTSYAKAEKLTEEGKLSSSKRPEPIKIDDVPGGNFDDALVKAREINAKYVGPKAAKANAIEINKTFGDFLEAYDARMNQLDTEYKTADASRKIEIDEERAKLFAAGEEVAQANAAEGSEAGMKLRMRQEIRGARNEVELAAAIDRELERSIGRKMTKEERDQVIPRGRKVREAHAKVTAAEQADNEAIFQDILRSVGVKTDGGIKQTVDARKASIKQDVEGIRKIIAKYSKGGTTKQSGAILDVPKIMAEAAPLIMNIVKKSVANAKDITVDKAITIIREVFDRFGLDHSAMKDEDIIGVIAGRFRQTAREASEVSKRVAELRKMARSMDVDGQIETANRRLASVAKQIEDFKAGREPKTETAKGRVIADDKLAALNQTQGAIKEQLKVLRELKAQNVTPEQMIEKIDKRISDIEARTKENIKSGTWPKRSQRTMPTSIELEKRLEELKIAQIEADMARRHLREAAELKEMTKGQKALAGIETAYNAVRQLNASTDISWSFNHGWYTVFTHPGVWARSTVGGLKGIRTAEGYKKAVADVMSDPAFREARAAGLRVLDLLGHHDEYLRGIDYEHSKSLIARTAGYGVTVSQRNFDLTSTKARLEMYGKFVRFMESPWLGARKLTFDDKRNIAWAVNMMTGALPGNLIQGKIPQMIWFAPGYRIAKLMTSTPALSVLAVGRDPKLAAGLFADWLKFSAVGLAVLGMMPRGEDTTMARDSGLPQFGNLVRHTGATVVDGEIKDEFMNFDLFNGWLKPWGVLQQSIGRGKDFESWINENRENPSDSAIRAAEKASGIGYGEPGFDKALADYYNSKRSGKNKDWTAIFEGSAHPGGTLLARIASDIAGSPQKAFGETYDARLDKATTDAMGFFASLWPYAKSVLPLSAQTFINEVYPANLSDSQKAVLFIVAFTGFNMNRKVVDVRKGDQYDGKIENPVNFRKP